jgi:hypothetical protein
VTESLIKALEAGLSLWQSKEKRKYLDELISLKKEFYAERNKPREIRSNAILDDVRLRLRLLCDSVASAIGASGT